MNNEYIGKIIFFLYPINIIEKLALELVKNEYEVYLIDDKNIMIELLKKHDDSILYINIDEASMKEKDWEDFILNIVNDEELIKKVNIGLLTHKKKEHLIQKYLFDIGIKCGYIELNLKLVNSVNFILKTLEAKEARGRRKYLRVSCGKNAKFNIEIKDSKSSFMVHHINGVIHDISSFGFACKIIDEKYKDIFTEKLKFKNIQLNLRGFICIVAGEIMLKREDMYIFKFDPVTPLFIKNKIYQFIYNEHQINIKNKIKSIKENLKK